MREQKGEITVFLSLVLVILISVLFSVIEAARINAVQFQTECVADMALQSALAEYNRELLEQYDLFFIETGYGTEQSGYLLLEQHIEDYMKQNFQIEDGFGMEKVRDLLMLYPESVAVQRASGAADHGGEVLERKAVDHMLFKYGLSELTGIGTEIDLAQEKGLLGDMMQKKRQQNESAIDDVDTTVTDKEGKTKKIPINNPADAVNRKRGSSGILKLVTDGAEISQTEISLQEYFSFDGYEEKDGFLLGETAVTNVEDLIFQRYLMEKCGNYTKKKEGSLLAYEMEYILAGKASDYENLRAVVNRLLTIRETANFLYLMSDSGKQAEAEALALTLSAVILFPELKDLIKLSILIAWSYAESVNDVRILLSGGKVPLWKEADSWKLGLENALKLELGSGGAVPGMTASGGGAVSGTVTASGEKGLSYEIYLHLLLAVMEKKERNQRFLDVIEMDVRQTEGNENFQINRCLHAFEAEIITASRKGHSCLIKRVVGYQK